MKRKIIVAALAAVCAICLALCFACSPSGVGETPAHEHTFDMTDWEYDEYTHWHRATCEHDGLKKDEQSHTFEGDVCPECGYDRTAPLPGRVYKTVTFDLNYATDKTLPAKQFEAGKLMTGLPVPERDGYKFICWKDLAGEEYNAASVMPERDLTLYAEWQKTLDTYKDEYVLFKPATEGYKSYDIYMEYSGEHIDKYVYVEITSDDLGGAQNLGKKDNFTLKTIEGMEYRVNSGYTWMWYQNSFDTLNGAQRFTLDYGSNVQLITVSDGGGSIIRTYLLDIYVKHDYQMRLYKSIFDSEPYDTIRVIEGDTFPADTPAAQTSFEFDKRVYMNSQTGKYEDFVYSTIIMKDWSLYQTYKPYTVEAELNEGTLDGELQIKPYTQFFTLPSPEKDGFDFLGWQDTNGKYITNVQGYSGAHYVSEEYRPEKLTAVFAEKKHYYEFDGEQLRVYAQSVPVVTYTDKTMETILEIVYVPYGEDCTLPVSAPEYDDAALSGWQYYNYSSGEWATSLTDFNFNRKITSPIALAPKTVGISNAKTIPLNAEKTFNGKGDYKFYLPTAQEYTMEITSTGSASFSLKPDGATLAQSYTVSSGSPKTITVYNYRYNLGAEVKEPGSVLMNVSSLSGSFTVKIIGATATTDGSPVGVYDSQKALSQNSVSIEAAQKKAYSFSGWYKGEQRITQEFEHSFPLTETVTYTAKWALLPHLEDFDFESSATELIITGVKNKTAKTLIVPDQVTSIGQKAFENCTAEIKWGGNPSIKEIGVYAFYGYKGTSITLPNGVTSIRGGAFWYCENLTSIIIPNSVTSIYDSAFAGCKSLTSITLPFVGGSKDAETASKSTLFGYIFGTSSYAGGTPTKQSYDPTALSLATYYIPSGLKTVIITGGNILYGAFKNCTSLESVTIGNGVTSIGRVAFYKCTSLESVTIGESVTSIGGSAFEDCTSLESVTIGNGVTSIGESAFYNCALTSVIIPDSVTSIGGSAFAGCKSLVSVYITDIKAWCDIDFTNEYANPLYYAHNLYLNNNLVTELTADMLQGVTEIDYTFLGCTSLTSITIPDSVTSIGSSAFYNCTSLESITVTEGNTTYASQDGILYNKGKTKFIYIPKAIRGSVTIPDSVTSIGESAFYNRTSLESVTIGNSVDSIGKNAFYNCPAEIKWGASPSIKEIGENAFCGYKGTSITIPDSVTSISLYAFKDCTSLESVTIGNGVTSIAWEAFLGCTSLTSITIPDSVTSIGDNVFYECTSLESVYITDIKAWCNIDFADNTANPLYYAHNLYLNNNLVTELTAEMLQGVTEIKDYTFLGCTSLVSIAIPDSVTSINNAAFYQCTNLTSISIPNSVISIGSNAFSGCTNLTSITIPNSVTSIGDYAFFECKNLTSITIPDSVTSIGYGAFKDCTNLTSVTFNNPNGWYRTTSNSSAGSWNITSESLQSPATAAQYLKDTYYNYDWKRKTV